MLFLYKCNFIKTYIFPLIAVSSWLPIFVLLGSGPIHSEPSIIFWRGGSHLISLLSSFFSSVDSFRYNRLFPFFSMDRRLDGWMASQTRWTCVWASSRSWWWTGKPGVLQSMGSQSGAQLGSWTELSVRKYNRICILTLLNLLNCAGDFFGYIA